MKEVPIKNWSCEIFREGPDCMGFCINVDGKLLSLRMTDDKAAHIAMLLSRDVAMAAANAAPQEVLDRLTRIGDDVERMHVRHRAEIAQLQAAQLATVASMQESARALRRENEMLHTSLEASTRAISALANGM